MDNEKSSPEWWIHEGTVEKIRAINVAEFTFLFRHPLTCKAFPITPLYWYKPPYTRQGALSYIIIHRISRAESSCFDKGHEDSLLRLQGSAPPEHRQRCFISWQRAIAKRAECTGVPWTPPLREAGRVTSSNIPWWKAALCGKHISPMRRAIHVIRPYGARGRFKLARCRQAPAGHGAKIYAKSSKKSSFHVYKSLAPLIFANLL